MSDEIERETADALSDDSQAYAEAQAQAAQPADDPLAAIKRLRLEQLAVCRLKTEQEMQAMREQLKGKESEQ